MKINISILRQSIDMVLQRIQDLNGDVVEIDEDYYWGLDSDEMFNFDKIPSIRLCGSLIDDYSEIAKLSKSTDRANIVDLERIAGIITALSYGISNSRDKFM